ncbi:UDP-2,3-diacylglucosamine diphosphatase [Vibrio agarivorans]|uniref:UDP-2,3-diacylglucosamine diphosphatase n=1 Tax=Vibrio agarivorans TaxID=153622 RepID=UPI002232BFE0|nr:UDP-2,3-diacylglucosamine diphosphatase [Vibrio agarivorans]MDN3659573.1 UDP-2,3-diacylglucosamine diphosphatase [Vibrio agarivorans]
MTTLFISDLHLSPNVPKLNQAFFHFMQEEAPHADAVYVLGDLFDFWTGDDDPSPFCRSIIEAFKQLTSQGVPCYFTRGNRDFLVGKRFTKETGVTLLGDETVIDLYGRKAVVLHGDTLCTLDEAYLNYRKKVHLPWLQWLFNHLPFSVREKIVAKIKGDIKHDKQSKSLDIMDVTQSEVEKVMRDHQVDLMIHGHTHRPNVHRFTLNHQPASRVVLGDWGDQGYVLRIDDETMSLDSFAID